MAGDVASLLARANRQAAALRGDDVVPRKFVAFCDWLGVSLTPGQRALARVAFDGEPVDDEARALVGDANPDGPMPVVAAVCGGRAGKSYVLIALRLLWGLLVRDLRSLAPGQQAVSLIVAPNDTLRQEVINYALGAARSHPTLKAMLRLPKGATDDDTPSSFLVVRPDGAKVSFEGGVATRGGYGGRGRTLTDFAMDECAFFRDSSAKVNDAEIFKAASPRVLPGGQSILASTPWAEAGLLYEMWRDNWGNPTTALVAHAPTLALRPAAREMVERERVRDPDNARREFDAEFMTGGTTVFFEPSMLEAAVDPELTPVHQQEG